jgi:hypothetical protein
MTEEQVREAFAQKVARGIFDPVARHITGSEREERWAEAVAMTFEMFERYARRGVLLDDGILVHACRQRAVDLGRHLVRGEHSKRDVLDPRNYHQGRVEVLHLDGLPDQEGVLPGEEDLAVHAALVDGLARDPRPELDSALDLTSWLATLPAHDQAMLAARYSGHTLQETALAMDSSLSAVFARLKRLGRELADHAGITIRKKHRKARTRPQALQPQLCTA